MQKVLIIWGGWEGHEPQAMAQRFSEALSERGCDVDVTDTCEVFSEPDLTRFDLIIPNISMGSISEEQLAGLLAAVRSGTGLAGIHGGMCDSFRGQIDYQWMTGGQFLGHPHVGDYSIRLKQKGHPLTDCLPPEFNYHSEQYYMMVDPAVDILAETTYHWDGKDVPMPVIWTKHWGKGRVFYSALGHLPEEFDTYPEVFEMTLRGMLWAAR
jgi:type 1 glutamine amidotransferase